MELSSGPAKGPDKLKRLTGVVSWTTTAPVAEARRSDAAKRESRLIMVQGFLGQVAVLGDLKTLNAFSAEPEKAASVPSCQFRLNSLKSKT